jgi:hypothetical protein
VDHEAEEHWRLDDTLKPHWTLDSLCRDLEALGFSIVHRSHTTGPWERLAFELSHIIHKRSRIAFALLVPLLKGLAMIDTLHLDKRVGDGMLVLVKRTSS